MKTKKLTKEEIVLISKVANNMLSVCGWSLELNSDPRLVTFSINGVDNKEDWYSFFVEHSGEKTQLSDSYHENAEPLGIAWMIVYRIWSEFDGDMNSDLAENLWPRDNGFRPDYEKFLDNDE